MKIIKKLNENQDNKEKHTKVEIIILKKLKHPNIVKFFTYFEDNDYYYSIIEYIKGPNLFDLYISYKINNKTFEEKFLWDLLGQCLEAITYIHSKGVIHRDIKLLNIMLDENNKIKIIDFNGAGVMDKAAARAFTSDQKDLKNILSAGTAITNSFEAPEVYQNKYNAKIDIFSLGRVFYELSIINNNNIFNY